MSNEALWGLTGVIIGFLLTFLKDLFKEKRINDSIRKAILSEIRINADRLKTFWEGINRDPEESDGVTPFYRSLHTFTKDPESFSDFKTEFGKDTLFYRYTDEESPRWCFKVWDSIVSMASSAMAPKHFSMTIQFYEKLSLISEQYQKIQILVNEEIQIEDSGGELSHDEKIENVKQRSQNWLQMQKIVDESSKMVIEIEKNIPIGI